MIATSEPGDLPETILHTSAENGKQCHSPHPLSQAASYFQAGGVSHVDKRTAREVFRHFTCRKGD